MRAASLSELFAVTLETVGRLTSARCVACVTRLCRFVSMDTEEDAKDTLLDLRLKKRTFRGQAVKARLKTETVIRSYYPLPGAPVMAAGYPGYPVGAVPMDMRAFGYALPQAPVDGVYVDATGAAVQDVKASGEEAKNTNTGSNSNNNKPNNSGNKDNRGADNSKKNVAGGKSAPANNNNNNNNNRKPDANARNSKGGAGGRKEHDNTAARPHIEINSANFPPLSSEDTPVPTPGYKDAFIKYSFEEVLSIVKEVKEATLPADINPVSLLCLVLLSFCLSCFSLLSLCIRMP